MNLYRYVYSVGKPPLETNLYQYALNNPLRYIDPLGLYSFQQFLQETAAYSGVVGTALVLTPGGQPASIVFFGISVAAIGLDISLYSQHPYIDTAAESAKIALPVKQPYNMFTDTAVDFTAEEIKRIVDKNYELDAITGAAPMRKENSCDRK